MLGDKASPNRLQTALLAVLIQSHHLPLHGTGLIHYSGCCRAEKLSNLEDAMVCIERVKMKDWLMVRHTITQLTQLLQLLVEDGALRRLARRKGLVQTGHPELVLQLRVGQLQPEAEGQFGDHLAGRQSLSFGPVLGRVLLGFQQDGVATAIDQR